MAIKKDTLEIHLGCNECELRQKYAEFIFGLLCQNCRQNFDQKYEQWWSYYMSKQIKQEHSKKVAKCLWCIHRSEFYQHFFIKLSTNCQKCFDKINNLRWKSKKNCQKCNGQ